MTYPIFIEINIINNFNEIFNGIWKRSGAGRIHAKKHNNCSIQKNKSVYLKHALIATKQCH